MYIYRHRRPTFRDGGGESGLPMVNVTDGPHIAVDLVPLVHLLLGGGDRGMSPRERRSPAKAPPRSVAPTTHGKGVGDAFLLARLKNERTEFSLKYTTFTAGNIKCKVYRIFSCGQNYRITIEIRGSSRLYRN